MNQDTRGTLEALGQVTVDHAPVCRHHWIIETPNGPESEGTCRKCGQTRMFSNWDERFAMIDGISKFAGERAKVNAL